MYREMFYGRHTAQRQLQCSQIKIKRIALKKKNTQNNENQRLGFIKSLHMGHCSLQDCEWD